MPLGVKDAKTWFVVLAFFLSHIKHKSKIFSPKSKKITPKIFLASNNLNRSKKSSTYTHRSFAKGIRERIWIKSSYVTIATRISYWWPYCARLSQLSKHKISNICSLSPYFQPPTGTVSVSFRFHSRALMLYWILFEARVRASETRFLKVSTCHRWPNSRKPWTST